MKGDRKGALESATKVLNSTNDPVLRIRALQLNAKANPRAAVTNLCEALHIAKFHSIEYWEGLIALEIANIQVRIILNLQSFLSNIYTFKNF